MARSFDIAEFNSSDGMTPMQTSKLNANFRRLVEMVSVEQPAVKPDVDVSEVVSLVMPYVYAAMGDYLLPIGTVLMVGDSWTPPYGTWVELSSYDGRYVVVGSSYGDTGGSSSHEVPLPLHSHSVPDAGFTQVACEPSYDPQTAVEAVVPDGPADTSAEGVDPASIDIDPPYVTMRFVRRTA